MSFILSENKIFLIAELLLFLFSLLNTRKSYYLEANVCSLDHFRKVKIGFACDFFGKFNFLHLNDPMNYNCVMISRCVMNSNCVGIYCQFLLFSSRISNIQLNCQPKSCSCNHSKPDSFPTLFSTRIKVESIGKVEENRCFQFHSLRRTQFFFLTGLFGQRFLVGNFSSLNKYFSSEKHKLSNC